MGKISRLFAFHCEEKHFVEQHQFFSVLLDARFYSLGHKILGYDLLDFCSMLFFVGNPSDELIVVYTVFFAQFQDFLH
jgi:hypothetical protein